ncbi:PilZ domain-containing protein [Desulfobulbus sp. US1]|uniref:PilZ domain-containing protein n=1 Tax=Candidatus Electrothrix communis TaxID=1859133 RepID=A0A3S3QWJ9_9BACT|nr:PilZ domain-containing protein [Desulfobulbus sp. US4]MCW5207960.1 PilZ domain-containing protein [Desulfobulbus sp. US2]MCW5209828.1 PilZ domain-containing protein [Desulfobulbus sp. US1]MCW5210565.1 PilZ domain-containing protein [Desulfobulbus sp. N3]MCW5213900.1 PilZ domain-containing protein [Desulfobulbus sp. US5]RWX49580.1 PilZ domain-containing protein [Candidatus Electrothrix communis]
MVKTIQEEKRRYTRVIFNERNRVQAVVALPEKQDPAWQIPAAVLNMSEGGMQVTIERKKFQEMQQGDTVLLSRITGIQDLESLRDVPIQLIWIMDNEYLEHVLLGMSFSALSERQLGILRLFVTNRLALTVERGGESTFCS